MPWPSRTGLFAVATLLLGCGDDVPAATTVDDDDWQQLVEGTWELPAAVEGYRCVRATVPDGTLLRALRPTLPPGTHHVTLGIDDDYAGPDGPMPCTAADIGDRLLYAAGVGTDVLELPAGTALELPAGTRLVLNLHLLNASSSPLSGTSGVLAVRAPPDEDPTPLEVVLAGNDSFTLPAASETTITGVCTAVQGGALIGVMPHMHTLGRHMRVVLRRTDASQQVLHDAPYSFESQRWVVFDPILDLAAGDVVDVSCTFDNTTAEEVEFGSSTRSEMCFAALLRETIAPPSVACVE